MGAISERQWIETVTEESGRRVRGRTVADRDTTRVALATVRRDDSASASEEVPVWGHRDPGAG